MPRLSDSMEEGTILTWLKADGDEVAKGDELVEIETDKATMTYESPEAGALTIVAAEGTTLPVGAVIATSATGRRRRLEPTPAGRDRGGAPAEQRRAAPGARNGVGPARGPRDPARPPARGGARRRPRRRPGLRAARPHHPLDVAAAAGVELEAEPAVRSDPRPRLVPSPRLPSPAPRADPTTAPRAR